MLYAIDVAAQSVVFAGNFGNLADMALDSRVEDALDERRFTGAADTRDDRHDVEGYLDVDALQVVHACAVDGNLAVPRAARNRNGNVGQACQVAHRVAIGELGDERREAGHVFFHLSLINDFAS